MKNRVFVSLQEEMEEPVWLKNVEPFVQNVMDVLEYENEEVSILFCNDEYIRELNKNYRNIDASTDVLSFESGDEYEDEEGTWYCAGDIVISVDTLPVNAEYFNQKKDEELKRLLVHGLLHLNGMDHGEEHIEEGVEPVGEMLVLQEKTLKSLCNYHIIEESN